MDIYANWDYCLKGFCLHTATEKLYAQDFSNCVCLDAFLSSNRLHVCMYNKDDFPLVLSTQLADDISVHYSTYMHAECAGLQICKCSKVQPFM